MITKIKTEYEVMNNVGDIKILADIDEKSKQITVSARNGQNFTFINSDPKIVKEIALLILEATEMALKK